MPEFIVNLIIDNHSLFNDSDWREFVHEIKSANSLEKSNDFKTWNRLLKFSQNNVQKYDDSKKQAPK